MWDLVGNPEDRFSQNEAQMFSPLGQSDVNCEVKVLHGVSLKLLQMVYLCYQGVYSRLHEVVAKGSPITDKARYCNYWFGHSV